MVFLELPESQPCVAKAQIRRIPLRGEFEVALSFDIPALGLREQECVFEGIQVLRNSGFGSVGVHLAVERFCQTCWICEGANGGGELVCKSVEHIAVLDLVALDDICPVYGFEQAGQISSSFLLVFFERRNGHAAPEQVVCPVIAFVALPERMVFGEAQRLDPDFSVTIAEVRDDVG